MNKEAVENGPVTAYGKHIRVSVWQNQGARGNFITFRLERRYKDPADGQWKSSASLSLPQAMRMHALLGKAIADHLDHDEAATAEA